MRPLSLLVEARLVGARIITAMVDRTATGDGGTAGAIGRDERARALTVAAGKL